MGGTRREGMFGSTSPSWPNREVAPLKQVAADADALCIEAIHIEET
jgi:hypothetical protein